MKFNYIFTILIFLAVQTVFGQGKGDGNPEVQDCSGFTISQVDGQNSILNWNLSSQSNYLYDLTVECSSGDLLYYARTALSSDAEEIACCMGGGTITITYRFDSTTELPIDDCTEVLPIPPCTITDGCMVGIGTPCDDNNPSTTDDVIGPNCSCIGTPIVCEDFDLDGICDDIDCDPNDPGNMTFIGMSCDDGEDSTINDIIVAECECQGEPIITVLPPDCEEEASFEPKSWYELYSRAYNQELEKGNEYKAPSDVKNEIVVDGMLRNSLELVYMNCDIDVKKAGGVQSESVIACGLVVPDNNVITDDCVVDVYFPCYEIDDDVESDCTEFNMSQVQNITVKVNNQPVMASISCGETVTLEVRDVFHQEIEFVVEYESGDTKSYNFDSYNDPRLSYPQDYQNEAPGTRLYPDCVGPPVLKPGPGGPTVGPGPGPTTPDYFKKCRRDPDDEFTVVSTIDYDTHIPANPFSDIEFLRYSTPANPSVYNDRSDWDQPFPTEEQFRQSNSEGAIDASVYLNPSHTELTRPIIITDGIDFFSSRKAREIMETGLTEATIQQLFENGFDVIIADYKGGADFMQKNAFAMIELIDVVQQQIGE